MQDGRKAPGFSLDSKVRTEATATSSDYTARPKVDNGQAIEVRLSQLIPPRLELRITEAPQQFQVLDNAPRTSSWFSRQSCPPDKRSRQYDNFFIPSFITDLLLSQVALSTFFKVST